jgi:broad specificity phosphatase PhoE
MKVILVRHGDAVAGEGKFHGLVDNPLTDKGKKEVEETAPELKQYNPKAIYSSPMTRAKQTADIIGKHLKLPVQTDNALKPLDLGNFVGKSTDKYTDEVRKYISSPNKKIPGGGTVKGWADKFIPFINKLIFDKSTDSVIVVTHGRNILLTKAELPSGNNSKYDTNTLLTAGKSTEHGGYAIAEPNHFEIKTPKTVKAGQS